MLVFVPVSHVPHAVWVALVPCCPAGHALQAELRIWVVMEPT